MMTDSTEVDDLIDTNEKADEINEELLYTLLEKPEVKKIDSTLQRLIKTL